MARRERRRSNRRQSYRRHGTRRRKRGFSGNEILLAELVAAGSALILVLKLVQAHPVLSLSIAASIVAVALLGGLVWKRRRDVVAARLAQIEFARSQEVERYHAMTAAEFEQALAYLCARDGCTQARVVGRAGDLGADVIAIAPGGHKLVLQAKRYGPSTKVTGPDLQRFGGTCFAVHRAVVAAVVTTSTFTKQAKEYARHMGIKLFDADALAAWASRTGPAPWQ